MTPSTDDSREIEDQSTTGSRASDAPVPATVIRRGLPSDPDPITFDAVSKQYDGVTAVEEASFSVRPGECHILAGPNGSGKTTLGRIAVGLTDPTSGAVRGPTESIGYGFQTPRFYPSLSVRENLATFCSAAGVDAESSWLEAITDSLRLSRVAHRPAGDLSGGFKKKLDLAIALVGRPTYVWFDEPIGDLDDVSVSRVIALLDAYVEAGGGVVVSTHDFEAFEDLCTHLTVFLDGVQTDTIDRSEPDAATLLDTYRRAVESLSTEDD